MAKPEVTGAQRLLIDLGATNARFALQRAGAAPEQSMRISVRAQPNRQWQATTRLMYRFEVGPGKAVGLMLFGMRRIAGRF